MQMGSFCIYGCVSCGCCSDFVRLVQFGCVSELFHHLWGGGDFVASWWGNCIFRGDVGFLRVCDASEPDLRHLAFLALSLAASFSLPNTI